MFSITNECATMYLFQNPENSLKEADFVPGSEIEKMYEEKKGDSKQWE